MSGATLPATLRNLFRLGQPASGPLRADQQIRMLDELTRAVGSSLEGPDAAHPLITEAVTSLLHVERSILFMAEPGASHFRIAAASGIIDPAIFAQLTPPIHEGAIGEVYRSGRSIRIADTNHSEVPLSELAGLLGARSILAVPLKVQNEVLGVLTADTRRDGTPLGEADLRLLQVFGGFAALVASEARLIAELRNRNRELDGLFAVVRQLNSEAESGGVLQAVLQQAIEQTSAHSGSLVFVDPRRDELVIRASEGLSDKGQQLRLSLGEGVTGWVAREGTSARIDDVRLDDRYVAVRENVRSELAVPVRVGDRVIGVLNVDADHPGAFARKDQDLLEALADLAAARIRLAFLEERTGEDSQA